MIIPNLDFGGAQKSYALISQELSKRYFVICVVFNRQNIAPYSFGGKLISLEVGSKRNVITKLFAFAKRVNALRRIKKQYSIDVSVSFLEGADYVNFFSKVNDKIIFSIRGSKYNDQNIRGLQGWIRLKFLMPFTYRNCDAIVTVNDGIKKEMERITSLTVPITVISNSISEKQSKDLPKKDPETDYLLSVGRLAQEKGFHWFLEVFKQIKRTFPNLQYVIVGDGPYKEVLKQKCIQLGLSYSLEDKDLNNKVDVHLVGYVSEPERFYRNTALLVLSSYHEGFPNVLLEAMSFGVPVVAADCSYGPAEILQKYFSEDGEVKGKYGVLAPLPEAKAQVVEQWTDIICKLLGDANLRNEYASKSRLRVKEYSVESMSAKWFEVIDSTIRNV